MEVMLTEEESLARMVADIYEFERIVLILFECIVKRG